MLARASLYPLHWILQRLLTHYAELNAKRQYLDERARELLTGHPDFERLCTLPGVAAVNALVILAEAGDLRRFHHHRQFLKYCGLDLAKTQSGEPWSRNVIQARQQTTTSHLLDGGSSSRSSKR